MTEYLMVLSVMIAAIAAGAAWKAAKETQKASLAHFILEDRRTYGSHEMLGAMMELVFWRDEHEGNSAQTFGEGKNSGKRKDYSDVKKVDEARRMFTKYSGLTEVLLKHDLIDEELAKELRPKNHRKFYRKFVEPLEKMIKTAADK